jgi:RNA polymerase sigma-70 factor (ECF subfamily)
VDDVKWLIAREIPHLRRYALALVGDADEADDVLQDCLERALRKRSLWRREGSIKSWLFKILYNVHIGRLRRRRPSVSIDAENMEFAAPAAQESRIHCQNIAMALAALPVEQRAAILLVTLEGMSYDTAADILDVPVGTVRSRLSRGRDALRTMGIGQESRVRLQRLK